MRATVVEISTTIEPSKRASKHTLLIGPSSARSTADAQRWRLFDLAGNRVITVDEIEKTVRSEPLQSLVARRRHGLQNDVPDDLPKAEYSVGTESRTIQGVPARQSVVRMGRYERQLWIASHPQIPPQLFAMMHAAEEPSAMAPLARGAEEALLTMRGFPLLDHAELPYGNDKLVVDRTVTAIRQERVSAEMLQIPRGYRELPPPPVPAPRPVRRATPKPPPPPTETTATDTTATTATTETTATATDTSATDTTATTGTTATETATTATAAAEKPDEKKAPEKKATEKKPPAKKPVVKKPAAKKPAAKKAPPKKPPVKKRPAKRP